MPISKATAFEHIAAWQVELATPIYPYRKFWPKLLFHHSPLENAIKIIREDALRARNDPELSLDRDVAAAEVLAAKEFAQNYVRFYFRPGTPTQFHIEGIRKPGECKFGDPTHCPILIMFVFNAEPVLTSHGTCFSDGNMQSAATTWGEDDSFFLSLPFSSIYSVGPCDTDVVRMRCAEVLALSPVKPSETLNAIVFRSTPERDTFLYMIGDLASYWRTKCHVSDALKTFEKRFSFIDKTNLEHTGVSFTMNPRYDGKMVDVSIEVLFGDEAKAFASIKYNSISAKPPIAGNYWKWNIDIPDGEWIVKIEIDGHLAYLNKHTISAELY
ncbi:DUF4433 domain-containing protein [Shimia sp. CNT1-13L.2]|uniref:DarT ssDNA thymidine ADP-ribosyltransferase family protein n=1 Tax=Shimia sp. CNT1-13L.2 TaxID=2959663 RepID=UPI0020CD58B2|nr:DarT ssDNA thymidine ADP-ribosyltransferase family protein [Shimia sp. CNT1-13L.2]MCP9480447.1 DUF4433 domain-containing protein [Shimia sp. CNT1-13L.2]